MTVSKNQSANLFFSHFYNVKILEHNVWRVVSLAKKNKILCAVSDRTRESHILYIVIDTYIRYLACKVGYVILSVGHCEKGEKTTVRMSIHSIAPNIFNSVGNYKYEYSFRRLGKNCRTFEVPYCSQLFATVSRSFSLLSHTNKLLNYWHRFNDNS